MMEENTELKTTTCNIYIERNSEQPCYDYRKWHKSIEGTVCTWNFTCSPSKTCSLALFCGAVAIRFYDLCKLPHISNHVKTCNRFLSFIDFVVDIHIRPMQHSAGFLFSLRKKKSGIAWAVKIESVFVCHCYDYCFLSMLFALFSFSCS